MLNIRLSHSHQCVPSAISRTHRFSHITPIRIYLPWFPSWRTKFQISLTLERSIFLCAEHWLYTDDLLLGTHELSECHASAWSVASVRSYLFSLLFSPMSSYSSLKAQLIWPLYLQRGKQGQRGLVSCCSRLHSQVDADMELCKNWYSMVEPSHLIFSGWRSF